MADWQSTSTTDKQSQVMKESAFRILSQWPVENAIRPTALGKKNWLFFGSEEAGQRSAAMDALIGNCRMHGVEPYAYLKDVLARLPHATNQKTPN